VEEEEFGVEEDNFLTQPGCFPLLSLALTFFSDSSSLIFFLSFC
jgi:hypothetical protein